MEACRSPKCSSWDSEKNLPIQPYTNQMGLTAYYEICNLEGKRFWDDIMKVPYIVSDDLWYGYDDIESIRIKMHWTKKNGFGGAFVWTLDLDDFNGVCGEGEYPIVDSIKTYLEELNTDAIDEFTCPSEKGAFADPESCTRFYRCLYGDPNRIHCPPKEEFDEKSLSCVPSYGCSLKSYA